MATEENRNKMNKNLLLKIILSGIFLLLSACAPPQAITSDTRIWHSFTFNTYEFDGKGKQDVEVLDFIYGDPKGRPNKCYPELVERGECQQGGNWNGLLYRHELKTLYVKWRVISTGETREVTLDMQKKLPANFGDKFELFFSFRGPQLYVYLVTPQRRAASELPNGPEATAYRKTLTLYPEE